MNKIYTYSEIKFIKDLKENTDLTWDEITTRFNDEFDENKTTNAVRKAYQNSSENSEFKPNKIMLEQFQINEFPLKQLFKRCGLKKNEILKVLVQPDTHVPSHDPRAVEAFCNFGKFYKPHAYINLGDFMDMEPLSHWKTSELKPRRFVPDVKKGREVINKIVNSLGPQCKAKFFLLGNHEHWLDQYLVERIPELADGLSEVGVELTIENLLQLKKLDFEVIDLNNILRIGKANFIHGYYTGRSHAAKHLAVFGDNIYYGHLHDIQTCSEVSIKGIHEASSLGCLSRLDAKFLKGKPNNWVHAFGIFEFRYDGTFTRYIPIIVNGKLSFMGTEF